MGREAWRGAGPRRGAVPENCPSLAVPGGTNSRPSSAHWSLLPGQILEHECFPGLPQALARPGTGDPFWALKLISFHLVTGPLGGQELSHSGLSSPSSPNPGCLKEVSVIHISYFSAVWAEQRYLSSCTHQALCRRHQRALQALQKLRVLQSSSAQIQAWEPRQRRGGASSPGRCSEGS